MAWSCEDEIKFNDSLVQILEIESAAETAQHFVEDDRHEELGGQELHRTGEGRQLVPRVPAQYALKRPEKKKNGARRQKAASPQAEAPVRLHLVSELRLQLESGLYDYSSEAVMERVHRSPAKAQELLRWMYSAQEGSREEV